MSGCQRLVFSGKWKVNSDRSVCTGFPFLVMKKFGTRSRYWLYNNVKVPKVKVSFIFQETLGKSLETF